MGGAQSTSASRIWWDICAIESNHVRAQMIEKLVASPDILILAGRAGVYEPVMDWLLAYRRGIVQAFPYVLPNSSSQDPRMAMYTPVGSTYTQTSAQVPGYQQHQMIVSPAAKALDYFQESLALLGIDESETLTYERLKQGYRRASIKVHPDKGGTKEAFDEVRRAFQYVEKILNRVNPRFSAEDKARMTAPVTVDSAQAWRASSTPQISDEPPVQLSAKKLDMSTFNKLFEEHRLPDPSYDSGYGDWLKSGSSGSSSGSGSRDRDRYRDSEDIAVDPRLKGKFTPQNFESVFREKALQQTPSTAIQRRLVPDAIMTAAGTELGGSNGNFTSALGADVQFTDLKEAYTTGSTMFQEVADVKVVDRRVRSVEEARKARDVEMSRVDPEESTRIAMAAAALEERERQRRLRLAQQDTAAENWSEAMRRRLLVNRS